MSKFSWKNPQNSVKKVGKILQSCYNIIMKLKRKIETELSNWLNTKTGLLVDGARQVGKTFSIKEFAGSKFDIFVYINLIENKTALEILKKSEDSKDFIFRLKSLLNIDLVEGKTCVYIDEIQEFKDFDIVTLSKFLIDEGSYRYIFSGSMLGVELNNVKSWPVGYVTQLKMFPLDFEEFCINKNVSSDILNEVKNSFDKKNKIPDFIHEKLMDIFREYIVIGGMPEVVSNYLENKNLNEIDLIYNSIVTNNRKDITKYIDRDKKLKIKEIYDLIPFELNKQNKRFLLNDINSKSKNELVSDSFLWVKNAGLAIPVYNAKGLESPLMLNADRNLMKLFMSDVGILNFITCDKEIRLNLLKEDTTINFGSIYENFVAEELNSHNFENIYYYNNKKNGEIDFVIEKNGKVIPIEVKSGKEYKRHSAINNILKINNYNIDEVVVFNNENVSLKEKVLYLPIYMVGYI